jgi:murein L,D-transpeptidase YafK
MSKSFMRYCVLLFIIFLFFSNKTFAQPNFISQQKQFSRVETAFKLKEDSLKKEFALKKIAWPPKQLYLRSFKYDSELEVWIKDSLNDSFKLLKSYKVCALSGNLGPKRMEGDYQVPEGFYTINEFNPKSQFHLSLGINYPNSSDDILSDSIKPGGEIFIHGNCLTTGCIPIKDDKIEELYLLATQVIQAGQDFIPLHIFPVKYSKPKSYQYLALISKDNLAYQKFAVNLQEAYEYFNMNKKMPKVAIAPNGDYVFLWKM